MSYGGGDRPGGVREGGCLLLLCCSSNDLYSGFLEMKGFFGGGFEMGFVVGCEGKSLKVVSWSLEASPGRTMVGNSIARWMLPLTTGTSIGSIQ